PVYLLLYNIYIYIYIYIYMRVCVCVCVGKDLTDLHWFLPHPHKVVIESSVDEISTKSRIRVQTNNGFSENFYSTSSRWLLPHLELMILWGWGKHPSQVNVPRGKIRPKILACFPLSTEKSKQETNQ
ncbi:unnamed protein product, partial [Coffea canephora]